ncbi:intradiol ring-cleavage dioxygenase [Photorhabdus luminescens subsp. luminescens]|uniref:Tat (Twin-arginine translocation) pathway signal sequence n=1 Tax=Photorhabdus luminescens TaxID=29488 RepID=A0A1G5QRM2_PHOLU|nr:intradiol ring-cleavage dioxygenase [Photorhabdus luminescens]KMW71569.1 intradiol ring-cleavage dioxygenase [Photorhabdus luminescens subsp. luminescens]SCZ64524.1 Tat (twin-arginine translocation) pathway signal sequence [Photorhabdus luminescens]
MDVNKLQGKKSSSRRNFLKSSAAITATAALAPMSLARAEAKLSPQIGIGVCTLAPEQISGPYFRNDKIVRRDITDSELGIPFLLKITVMDKKTCKPVESLFVDIWHCNSRGKYSGWSYISPDIEPNVDGIGSSNRTDDKNFLRGAQPSDKNGIVNFTTIYPGFYAGRATHIHIAIRKLSTDITDKEHFAFVGQMYFPEEINAEVYKYDLYSKRRVIRTKNHEDKYFKEMNGHLSEIKVTKIDESDINRGILGEIVLSIDLENISNFITKDDLYSHTV